MYKTHPIHILFALFIALFASTGCSDASASETTYMPLQQPCTLGADETTLGEFDIDDHDFDHPHDDFDEDLDDLQDAINLNFDDLEDLADPEYFDDRDDLFDQDPHAEPDSFDDSTIDINNATAEELNELPGIGPSLAGRIIEYRQDRQFATVHQLERVAGIGPAIMERLQPLIHVE